MKLGRQNISNGSRTTPGKFGGPDWFQVPEPQYDYSWAQERARSYWREVGMRDSWRLVMESIDEWRSEEAPRQPEETE